jgi:hypothetical protein
MNQARVLTPTLLVLVSLALAACAPAVRAVDTPVVIVVAGPTERPLEALDDAMRAELRRAGFPGSFGPDIIDVIAERRNLSEAQALRTSAELGRIGGGDVALYVHVAHLDRDVEEARGAVRRVVEVRLQLRVTLVDPASGALLWSTRDVVRQAVRSESTDVELPPLRSDPSALALRDQAVRSLARDVLARLQDLDP